MIVRLDVGLHPILHHTAYRLSHHVCTPVSAERETVLTVLWLKAYRVADVNLNTTAEKPNRAMRLISKNMKKSECRSLRKDSAPMLRTSVLHFFPEILGPVLI